MKTFEIPKTIARKVTEHTVLAAFSTVDYKGLSNWITGDLHADLHALNQLEDSPLVDAAKTLVKVAIAHSIYPNETTHTEARVARDALANIMIHTKEIKG